MNMPLLKRIRTGARGEAGQALIETALAIPVLLMIFFGIAKFGITFNNYIMLTDAVRVGSRQLVLSRGQSDPCLSAKNKLLAAAPGLNPSNLTITIVVNGATYGGTCNAVVMTPGSDATVTATFPCDLTIFGVNYAPACKLTSPSTARVE